MIKLDFKAKWDLMSPSMLQEAEWPSDYCNNPQKTCVERTLLQSIDTSVVSSNKTLVSS